jgi:Domain of unknown function (DUF4062)
MDQDTRTVIKIFLASPGDLQDERRGANNVVTDFNKLWADHLGYQVELVGWEDTVSVYGRPQATINLDLEQCDFFIGAMWRRWGTPPDISGPYTSGFEEEFENAIRRRRTTGRPEISLFFKTVDGELLRDPGEELKKVLQFKQGIVDSKSILFEEFVDKQDFEKRLLRCVTRYIQKLSRKTVHSEASFREGDPLIAQPAVEAQRARNTPFAPEAIKFLEAFLLGGPKERQDDTISAADIARFRLLAEITKTARNDKRALGVHDANILYTKRSHLDLSSLEYRGLLEAGLEHYSHENTPLWYWLSMIEKPHVHWLSTYSIVGESNQRLGAIAAMRLISASLPSETMSQRQLYINHWLADDTESIRVEALRYLGDCGLPADLPVIRAEADKASYVTLAAATDAVVCITLRDSRHQAIRMLIELQPSEVEPNLLERMFENGSSIPSNLLLECVAHRAASVRLTAARILRGRGELDDRIAEHLLRDPDPEVRLLALESLVEAGRQLSDGEAKEILTPLPTSQLFRAPIGLFGPVTKDGADALVHRRIQRIQAGEDLHRRLSPCERLGIIVVFGDVAVDRGLQIDDRVEAAALGAVPGESGEEGLDRVQPRARGRGEVEDEAGMAGEPAQDLGMLVGGIVVEDHVDHLAGRHRALDGVEKAQELLVAVALHAAAEHRPFEHVERGEQGGRAVAQVVMGHGAGLARFERQPRLGAVKRLDLGLLVDREHHGMLGRVDIEADDVLELGGELGIGRALEGPDTMRLQVVRRPDPLHRAQGDARLSGHRPAAPVGRFPGRLGTGQRHDPVHGLIAQGRLAGLAGGIAQQAIDPGFGEPPLPAPDRRPADAGAPADRGHVQPVGRAENDPSPRHVLLSAVAIGDDRLQTSTIFSRDQGTDCLSHGPSMTHLLGPVNPLFASAH